MQNANKVLKAYNKLILKHELLEKKYELLEQREAELDADTTMPPEKRLKETNALADGYARMAALMEKVTNEAKALKEYLESGSASFRDGFEDYDDDGDDEDDDLDEPEDDGDDDGDDGDVDLDEPEDDGDDGDVDLDESEDDGDDGDDDLDEPEDDEDDGDDEDDAALEKFKEDLAGAERDLALLRKLPATVRTTDVYREAYAAASTRRSVALHCVRFFQDKKREKEIKIIDSTLEKFSEELADVENDLAFLNQRPAKERLFDAYQEAYAAAIERKSDIELSMKLLRNRRAMLEKGETD